MTNKALFRNDKVVLLKEYEDLKQVGATYEVGNFTDEMVILRNAKTKVAVCAVSITDFYEYFEKKEDLGNKFTEWVGLYDSVTGQTFAFYRTNHKKVQVKLITTYNGANIRAEASCNKGDEFDLFFGIRLAYARAREKSIKLVYLPESKDWYNKISSDYKHTKNNIKDLLASLELKERTEG